MLDLSLLRILKHRADFHRVMGRIPASAIDKQTMAILKDYEAYFDRFDHERIDFEVFLPIFRSRHPGLTEDQLVIYDGILENAKQDVSDDVRQAIMQNVLELRMGTELANLLSRFDEGECENIYQGITQIIDGFKADAGAREIKWIDTDIGELLQDDINKAGLKWRLECLNSSMRPLRWGDFGIIAGRPDKGKTTLISSEATFMAPQLPPDQNVVWLNNEGPGQRIIPRLYQSAIGATRKQLIQLHERGFIREAYEQAVGRIDRIRVIDIHGLDNFSVLGLIERNNAGLVIYDMIDHIRGFGDAARTDLGLEKMYGWAREKAVQMGHVAFATSQISNDGDGMQFPTLGMLKDSKTGKQGACDFQLMIGASNDPGYNAVRYIGLPKNKLRNEDGPGDPRATVRYEPMRARYEDMPIAPEKDEQDGGADSERDN